VIIDAHTHAWPRWPYQPPVPDDASRGSYQNLLYQMDANGVDRALIVSARISRSEDNNDYGAAAVLAHPDRFVQIADIDGRWGPDYHAPGAVARLRELVDARHPAGISHYLAQDNDGWLRSSEGMAFFELVADSGLVVNLAAPPVWIADLRQIALDLPHLLMLINHLGVVGLHPGGIDEALELVLAADDVPGMMVKVSGYYYGSERPWDYPYQDRQRVVRGFYDRWGPARMVWASDFPSVLASMSYRQSLEVLREHNPYISDAEMASILGGNLARLFEPAG
jgi:L-fuconolactonase